MMSPPNTKHATSDHVNYLIWSYLQENGFGEAAVKLQQKWNNDPRTLPFANNVVPKALQGLVQKGLEYHMLQIQIKHPEAAAEAASALALYFGTPEGRQLSTAVSIRKQFDTPANVAKGPRKNGRPLPTAGLSLDLPVAKRPRRSGGDVSTTSDPTRIEQNGFNDHDHAENETDTNHDSPAENPHSANGMDIDEEPPTPTPEPMQTLNIGESKAVQLDQPVDLADKTSIQSLSVPNQVIMHLAYNPQDPSILAAGGEALARIWQSSKLAGSPETSQNYCDILPPSDDSYVSALAWSPNGEVLAIASRNGSMSQPAGAMSLWTRQGKCIEELPATQDMVFKVSWNAAGTHILGLTSAGMSNTSVVVWEAGSPVQSQPYEVETELRDVTWTSDLQFAVAGKGVIASSATGQPGTLDLRLSSDPSISSRTWTHIIQDTLVTTSLIASDDSGHIALIGAQGEILSIREAHEGELTGLTLRPSPIVAATTAMDQNRLLATSGMEGTVKLWDSATLDHLTTLTFGGPTSPVMSLSFTPDGHLLAAGNPNRIFIWSTLDLGPPKATWKREVGRGAQKKVLTNGNGANGHGDTAMDYDSAIGEDAEDEGRSISWDAAGKKLAMGVGSQFIVVDLGP